MWTYLPRITIKNQSLLNFLQKVSNQFFKNETVKDHVSTNNKDRHTNKNKRCRHSQKNKCQHTSIKDVNIPQNKDGNIPSNNNNQSSVHVTVSRNKVSN